MQSDGFRIKGVDGFVEHAGLPPDLPQSMTVEGVRPDAFGVHEVDDVYGFVEAKTERDIDNSHTRKQLYRLSALRMASSGKPCPIYVAIPRGSAYALDRVLIDLGLLRAPQIRRVHVPAILLERA